MADNYATAVLYKADRVCLGINNTAVLEKRQQGVFKFFGAMDIRAKSQRKIIKS